MDIYMIVLRLIHILFGIFWVGTALFFVFFFDPIIKSAGPAGGTVMGRLALTRFPMVMALSSILNTLSGILMYVKDSEGFQGAWISGLPGVALTIGGSAGILAFVVGFAFQAPSTARMSAVQKEIQSAGGKPTPAQTQELNRLQARITNASRWEAVLMVVTVLGMAIARELGEL